MNGLYTFKSGKINGVVYCWDDMVETVFGNNDGALSVEPIDHLLCELWQVKIFVKVPHLPVQLRFKPS